MTSYTPNEMMTIAAARALRNEDVCFVGIGMPSAAANLARLTHAPDIMLIYESGTLGTKPNVLPLSIGDGELCETALTTVSVPEMFRYWLQGGRITVGLPRRRADRQIRQSQHHRGRRLSTSRRCGCRAAAARRRSPPPAARFSSSWRRASAASCPSSTSSPRSATATAATPREKLGVKTKGPTRLMTDLAVFEPEPGTNEMIVTSIHPGVTREQIAEATGWPVRYAANVNETPAPTDQELATLRDLHARTKRAHGEGS